MRSAKSLRPLKSASRRALIAYASIVVCCVVSTFAAEPPPGCKLWTWPDQQGVGMRYAIDPKPFGGMVTGDYYLKNNNTYDAVITWAIQIVYDDGFSETLPQK